MARQKDEKFFLDDETGPSKRAQSHENWEPDWTERKFSTLLKCTNPACGELVGVVGKVVVGEDYYVDENGDYERGGYTDTFIPVFFDRPPPIFSTPKQCPKLVSENLVAAFALIWTDTAAAANRLRAAIEALLDDQEIKKFALSKARKREQINVHGRIELLASINSEASKYLMAIKWLGNAGSHGSVNELTRDDLLDAAELFEAAIELLYLKKAEKFAKMASAINRRKGKPKRPSKPLF